MLAPLLHDVACCISRAALVGLCICSRSQWACYMAYDPRFKRGVEMALASIIPPDILALAWGFRSRLDLVL